MFKRTYYPGIFLIAASTLLFEITLTKVFSIIHFHYFAFLIVSTALFGYGFSGVYLSITRRFDNATPGAVLFWSALLFAVSIGVCYKLILLIPLHIGSLLSSPLQMFYLGSVYLLLALPFFFSGLVIGVLLSTFHLHINKLYFFDLVGAGLGCFSIVLLIPALGGSGAILFAGILACLAALTFLEKWEWALWPAVLIVAYVLILPGDDRMFPLTEKSEKRHFRESIANGKVLYTGWSPASRIDVVTIGPASSVIWIDGGTNQSFMKQLDNKQVLTAGDTDEVWKTVELPFALIENPDVLIIGPGGGIEVASALGYKPNSITAVELDPLITSIVLNEFRDYVGNIYTRPGVRLINEEGRSFIRRSNRKYDIIQQKNNSHPMAVASGALNLTETYLLTKEAFHEYLDHLNSGGFLSIERHGGIRLMNLAAEVLKERGVADYWNHVALLKSSALNQVFLLKNGAFTEREIRIIHQHLGRVRDRPLYLPGRAKHNVFSQLMSEQTRERILKEAPFHLSAPTDDQPFMEHFFRLRTLFSKEDQAKLEHHFWKQAELEGFTTGTGRYSDLSLYVILFEAILLGGLFIILPLVKMKRAGVATEGAWRLLLYFLCLGIGFIFIEIAFIQKYILFIGYPVYAVATIIFAMLISAGLGSFVSSRFMERPFRLLGVIVLSLIVLTALQVLLVPLLFNKFLAVSFAGRIALAVLFIFPVGFVLGMPFPVGLSWISTTRPRFVPWAWGINGYATVVGSVLSVILALNFGFRFVLIFACLFYVVAFFSLRTARITEREVV